MADQAGYFDSAHRRGSRRGGALGVPFVVEERRAGGAAPAQARVFVRGDPRGFDVPRIVLRRG